MPIRINLLAEAQALDEMRRKDPVKRTVWVAGFIVCVVLIWIGKLWMDVTFAQGERDKLENELKSKTAKYNAVNEELAKTKAVDDKLAQLDSLHTNRFLWAPVLNALQKTMVPDIQVVTIRGQQIFNREEAHDAGSGGHHNFVPEAVVERDTLSIEARDYKSSNQNYNKYKEALCSSDFFIARLQRKDGFVIDGVLSALIPDPVNPNKQFVTFTLASHFPEIRRTAK